MHFVFFPTRMLSHLRAQPHFLTRAGSLLGIGAHSQQLSEVLCSFSTALFLKAFLSVDFLPGVFQRLERQEKRGHTISQ